MGTITTRKGKKGTTYRAQIRIREKGQIVHEESQSFPRKSTAQAWVKPMVSILILSVPEFATQLATKWNYHIESGNENMTVGLAEPVTTEKGDDEGEQRAA